MKIPKISAGTLMSFYKNAGSTNSNVILKFKDNKMKTQQNVNIIKISKFPNYKNMTYERDANNINIKLKSKLNVGLNLDRQV